MKKERENKRRAILDLEQKIESEGEDCQDQDHQEEISSPVKEGINNNELPQLKDFNLLRQDKKGVITKLK